MRFAVLVCLLSLAASDSFAQSAPYQWVGATSVTYDGSGNGLGFVGMTSQCRADFGPGARMCRSREIMDSDTLNLNSIPTQGCWVRTEWNPFAAGRPSSNFVLGLDESGQSDSPANMTCSSWASTGGTGLSLQPAGSLLMGGCSTPRSIACCAPTPVPSPTSLITIPIGVGTLAGLSMLKGGA